MIFLYISETATARSFKFHHNEVFDSLYFRPEMTSLSVSGSSTWMNVFIVGHVRVAISQNGSIYFEKVHSFGKGDLSGSFSVSNSLDMFAPCPQ